MKTQFDFFAGPQGVALKSLAQTLWDHGYSVYVAGGCVRDGLLGRPYKDIDIVTDASPESVQKLFDKTVPVGVQFGIVRVIIGDFEFEVARFRKDGPYSDGRHPEFIQFSSAEEDAHRRDFTVNALFYDLRTQQILDFVGGLQDLEKGILRTVGDPQKRFKEDYLRLLRLIRFSVQLDFKMDETSEAVAKNLIGHIAEVSGERLLVEIGKILSLNSQKGFELFDQWKVCEALFPEWTIEKTHRFYTSTASERGVFLGLWLLNFQTSICLNALDVLAQEEESIEGPPVQRTPMKLTSTEVKSTEVKSKWCYGVTYRQAVQGLAQRFRLSNRERHLVQLVGSILAWGQHWFQWRAGLRFSLAQSDDFAVLSSLERNLKVWPEAMRTEVELWQTRPRLKPFLEGKDVLEVPPAKRGLVLQQSLYLQYEGVLLNREQALVWLKREFQKRTEADQGAKQGAKIENQKAEKSKTEKRNVKKN